MRPLLLALFLAGPLAAQDTPQYHRTANVQLKNGTIVVYSVDSGGARKVVVEAYHSGTDTLLEAGRRGGTFSAPAPQVDFGSSAVLVLLANAAAGDTIPENVTNYSTGPVKAVTTRCTAAGCTFTITNRTKTGETRAGSWTTTRLPYPALEGLVKASRTAATHDTDAIFTYTSP